MIETSMSSRRLTTMIGGFLLGLSLYVSAWSHDVLVETARGVLIGETASSTTPLQIFKGIPYAKPPVGDLRWRLPEPPDSWEGQRRAQKFASMCTQMSLPELVDRIGGRSSANEYLAKVHYMGDEDCLYLNVWTPVAVTNESSHERNLLPTMVWLHGGGNMFGAGHFDGSILAQTQEVVVVSMNYRLGYFGFMAHPALQIGKDDTPNLGLMDQIRALKWVRNNIAHFGGDADRVTIFGVSAGGRDVLALLSSSKAKGLFHRAIAMSGLVPTLSVEQATNYVDDRVPGLPSSSGELLLQLLLDDEVASDRRSAKGRASKMSSPDIAAYLRGKSYMELDRAQNLSIEAQEARMPAEAPMVRAGVVIPLEGIAASFTKRSNYNDVPVLIGATKDEIQRHVFYASGYADKNSREGKVTYRIKEKGKFRLINEYISGAWKRNGAYDLAAIFGQHQPTEIFVYRFDWDEMEPWPGPDREPYGAVHGLDIPLLFGVPASELSSIPNLGSRLASDRFTDYEVLSNAIRSYWTQFAYSGDPNRGRYGNLPKWRAWGANQTGERVMILDSRSAGGLRMVTDEALSVNVLERLAHDGRLPSIKEKCAFLVELVNFPFSFDLITEDDRQRFLGGQCIK